MTDRTNTMAHTAGAVQRPVPMAKVLPIHEYMTPEAIARAWEEGRYNRAISSMMAEGRKVVSLDEMRDKANAGAAKVKAGKHDLQLNREALAQVRTKPLVVEPRLSGGWRPRLTWLMWQGMDCWRCTKRHRHINVEPNTGLVLGHLLPRSHPKSDNGAANLTVVCRRCDSVMGSKDWTGRLPSVRQMINQNVLVLWGQPDQIGMRTIPTNQEKA